MNSPNRRAESTLIENRREAKNLEKTFGGMNAHQFMPMHAYQYLDACEAAGRGQKGNKEITLAHLMFENCVRLGNLLTNPFAGVKKTKSAPSTRLVTETELDFVLRVGRSVGGNRHLAALALWTGYLCVRRSGELLSLRRSQIHEEKGISWTANKGQGSQISLKGTIVWSDTLRKTLNEALAFKRYAGAPDEFVFGNLAGQRYTKGGWKKTLSYLMSACADAAESEGRPFERFNLRDCRPAGVTEKLNNKDSDVMEATMQTSEVTMRRNYYRRRTRVAKPTK